MEDDEKQATRDRYVGRLREFGYDPRTLGWNKRRHKLRYEMLLSSWPPETASVLDVGCGFGDLYGFCQASGRSHWQYTGIDIVGELVDEGRRRYPDADLRTLDMDREGLPGSPDVIVASGLFNHGLRDNMAFVAACFERFAAHAGIGFAVNFMSPTAERRYDHIFYADPAAVLACAWKVSRRVMVRHDYMPFEYTVLVFKDDGFAPETAVFDPFRQFIDGDSGVTE